MVGRRRRRRRSSSWNENEKARAEGADGQTNGIHIIK
jgi:hypothetical protein